MTRGLVFIAAFVSILASGVFAREESVLARVTVYWPGEGGPQASSNGARLRVGHCAVDPDKIPYGSKVYFPDGPCVAVDTGPAVVNRKAARLTGRNARERGALVIDRYFDSKEKALAWERTHSHFMTVRVVSGRSSPGPQPIAPEATNIIRIAQTIAPPEPAQTSAPWPIESTSASPKVARLEITSAAAAMFSIPERSRISAPPSYHRRRFAAHAENETEAPPPTCTIGPVKHSRVG